MTHPRVARGWHRGAHGGHKGAEPWHAGGRASAGTAPPGRTHGVTPGNAPPEPPPASPHAATGGGAGPSAPPRPPRGRAGSNGSTGAAGSTGPGPAGAAEPRRSLPAAPGGAAGERRRDAAGCGGRSERERRGAARLVPAAPGAQRAVPGRAAGLRWGAVGLGAVGPMWGVWGRRVWAVRLCQPRGCGAGLCLEGSPLHPPSTPGPCRVLRCPRGCPPPGARASPHTCPPPHVRGQNPRVRGCDRCPPAPQPCPTGHLRPTRGHRDRKEPAGHPHPTWGTRGQEGTAAPPSPAGGATCSWAGDRVARAGTSRPSLPLIIKTDEARASPRLLDTAGAGGVSSCPSLSPRSWLAWAGAHGRAAQLEGLESPWTLLCPAGDSPVRPGETSAAGTHRRGWWRMSPTAGAPCRDTHGGVSGGAAAGVTGSTGQGCPPAAQQPHCPRAGQLKITRPPRSGRVNLHPPAAVMRPH